jgi:hypothetical protein
MIIYNWYELLKSYNLKGVIHIGTDSCKEQNFYNNLNIYNIVWIDAISNNPCINNFLVCDKDDEEYTFNISNNIESSSINNLKLHKELYPNIYFKNTKNIKSKSIDTIYNILNIKRDLYDTWYICTQGSELLVLKGGIKEINNIKIIIIKIYTKEVYESCPTIKDVDTFLKNYNFNRIIAEYTNEFYGFALYKNIRYI